MKILASVAVLALGLGAVAAPDKNTQKRVEDAARTVERFSGTSIEKLPTIVFRNPETLSARYLRANYVSRRMRVFAYYDPEKNTMHLPSGADLNSHKDFSILVHEMVHHYQNEQGRGRSKPDCSSRVEHEAYSIQKQYLAEHGLKFEDIGVSSFFIFLIANCMS